jgi:hypothetical protein
VSGVCLYFGIRGNKIQLAGKKYREDEKKTLAKLPSKLKKLLANCKFHSHLASWRVVISTPDIPSLQLFCSLPASSNEK